MRIKFCSFTLLLAALAVCQAPLYAAPQDAGAHAAAIAHAADAGPPSAAATPAPAPSDLVQTILKNAQKPGGLTLIIAPLLMLAVWLLRREQGWIAKRWKWLATTNGGHFSAFLLALLSWLADSAAAHSWTIGGFVMWLSTAGLAAWGWNVGKSLKG